jgi:hypothetical protein
VRNVLKKKNDEKEKANQACEDQQKVLNQRPHKKHGQVESPMYLI